MIAKIQGWLVRLWLLWVAGCTALAWTLDAAWAWWLVLLPTLVFLAVMALECALMHALNRRDPAARASLAQVLRAWAQELWAATVVFGWRQPFRAERHPDWLPEVPTGRVGVVLVHGYMCNRALWQPWLPRLRAQGHAHVALSLEPPLASIDSYAAQVEAAVRRVEQATGRAPVLVCHSMGGLVARAWLRAVPDADRRVARVITLGTPHAGTWLARWSGTPNGRQMRVDSAWLQAMSAAEPPERAARFDCWFSNCDNIVFPASTAVLAGARVHACHGLPHVQMALDEGVIAACLAQIAEADRAG